MKKEHKTITQLADVFSKFGIYLKSIAKEQEKKKNNKTLIKTYNEEDESMEHNLNEESDSNSESKEREEPSIMYSNKLSYHKFLKDGEHTFMFTYYREKIKNNGIDVLTEIVVVLLTLIKMGVYLKVIHIQ